MATRLPRALPLAVREDQFFLPGVFDVVEDYEAHGFLQAVRETGRAVDMLLVDAHLGYYAARTVLERLRQDVIDPARVHSITSSARTQDRRRNLEARVLERPTSHGRTVRHSELDKAHDSPEALRNTWTVAFHDRSPQRVLTPSLGWGNQYGRDTDDRETCQP